MIGSAIQHYQVTAALGAGGMGEVFRARDTRLQRDVALKLLPRDYVADTDRLRRFEQEARTLAALNHPNILTIHDAGIHDGAPYLISELLEGRTLREELDAGEIPFRRACDWMLQIAQGLAAAHLRGIIHRDLKPANLFITRDGRVKILDFGLAKLQSPRLGPHGTAVVAPGQPEPTQSGAVLGTPGYMSPEQVRGERVDHRSDLFSFGTVLYEMLAGRHPFRRGNAADTMAAILKDEPMPMPEGRGVPPSLCRIVERCLEKSPERRFQSAQDLAFAIDNATAAARPAPVTPAKETVATGLAESGEKSLAVIPFANMSDDRENEFLADGITEDLITALSRVKGLRVPARTSSFAFKGKNEDIRRIGQLLDVESVLEGSVRKAGNKLRVTAQLIKVRDGFHLWSDRYDREMKDVFDIQDDITRAIVGALEVQLGGGSQTQFVQRQTASTRAYELYAQGRIYCDQRGLALKKAVHYFELALLEDPEYALAFAGLAEALSMSCFANLVRAPDAMPRAVTAAEAAVRLAPDLADGHAVLGWVNTLYHWNWAEAERCFRRANEINPRHSQGHFWYASLLGLLGRSEESLAVSDRGVEVDPLSPANNISRVWWTIFARRFAEALAQAQQVIARWTDWGLGYLIRADCLLQLDRAREAVPVAEKAVHLMGRTPLSLIRLGRALVRVGECERAREILAELQQPRAPWVPAHHYIALLQWCLGDKEAAGASFRRGYEEREAVLPWLFNFPLNDELRGDPVIEELRRKLGLSA